jgi:GNAT superfamily N-acetyltransferase
MLTNLRKLLWLVSTGQFKVVFALLRRWLYSDATATGLARSLETPVAARAPRRTLSVRPIAPHEQEAFADTSDARGDAALVRINARHLFTTGIQTCYVAVTEDGTPVYMQYLIGPDQNGRLGDAFGELMPPLAADEAMLEFAFSREQYRSVGAMPAVVPELAQKARDRGARRLVTWVPDRNQAVLRYFERIGFVRFAARKERYRLFRRTVRFEPTAPSGRV